jgi:uncharacterized membrane protein YkoI
MKTRASLLVALLLLGGGAAADEDHEEARRLREAGEIVPLEVILDKVRSEYDGILLEVELEHEGGDELVYEVELLDSKGSVRDLLFDARTGEFIGYEKKRRKRH